MTPLHVCRRALTAAASSGTIAFFGIGNMGRGMALNLTKAGFDVQAFDPASEARDAAAAAGLSVAPSVEAAVKKADFVISMLPTGRHVRELYLGDGLLSRMGAATTVVDCSTIDTDTAREIGAAAEARGVGFLDAPVSGGTAAAAAGTLAFMCGGSESAFGRAKPALSAMGAKLFHAGPAGAGQVAKACNNMLLAIHMIGTTEVLSMGAHAGLAPEKLSEILLASSGRNWSLEVYNPYPGVMPATPASNGFAPGFMTDLMVKDLGLAIEAASGAGLDVRMGALAKELYEAHQAAGNGRLDFSSIIKRLAEPAK